VTNATDEVGAAVQSPADQDAGLPEIERGLSTIVRWGNLPRVRERYIAAAGMALERSNYAFLVRLNEHGPARLSDLARLLGIDLSTASRQVHALEQAGLVKRNRVEEDRRAAMLSLTPSGRAMVERILSARRMVITEILEGWSPDQRTELARVLAHLADDIVAFGCQERQ
jgi:DNA-binding MarR family transcriptional regulator